MHVFLSVLLVVFSWPISSNFGHRFTNCSTNASWSASIKKWMWEELSKTKTIFYAFGCLLLGNTEKCENTISCKFLRSEILISHCSLYSVRINWWLPESRTDAPFHLLLFCAAQNFVIILTVDIDILNNIKCQSTAYSHYWNERFQLHYQLVLPTPLPYRVQKLTLLFELIAEKLLKSTTSLRQVLSCTAQHFSPKVCA